MKRHEIAVGLVLVIVMLGVATGFTKAARPSAAAAPSSCIEAIKLLNVAASKLGRAGLQYANLIRPAYKAGATHSSTVPIVRAENHATALVSQATGLVRKSTPLAIACKAS